MCPDEAELPDFQTERGEFHLVKLPPQNLLLCFFSDMFLYASVQGMGTARFLCQAVICPAAFLHALLYASLRIHAIACLLYLFYSNHQEA